MPDEPEVCRSASIAVEIPAIVRLHDMVKLPSKIRTPPLTRRSLLLRDSYRCAYCLEHADTIDHVVPRSAVDGMSGRMSSRRVGATTC